jgi:hypothetical protein
MGAVRRALQSLGELVDRTWPWLPLGLLAAAVLVFAGSYVAGPGASDGEQVNDVAERFGIAVANSDGADACELATPAAQRRFQGSLERLSCKDVVRNFGVGVPGRQLRDAPRSAPLVRGDRAALELPTIGVRLVLAKRDGEWLIDGLQRFAARPRT